MKKRPSRNVVKVMKFVRNTINALPLNELKLTQKNQKNTPETAKPQEHRTPSENQCAYCYKELTQAMLKENFGVCPHCGHHYRLGVHERIDLIFDFNSFEVLFEEMSPKNPIQFPGYEEKIQKGKAKSGFSEAVLTGKGKIDNQDTFAAIMNFNFMGGSMGAVVGKRISNLALLACKMGKPLIIFSSSGGARMQEGIISLMQMITTSFSLAQLDKSNLLCIIVLTDPTYGGVTASFAMLGDIILSEPNAMIGFTGPRVIEGTIKQSLPEGFQTAEFLLEHGFVDKIVPRPDLKHTLSLLLKMHS